MIIYGQQWKCLSLHMIWFNCAKYSPSSFFSLWICRVFCGDCFLSVILWQKEVLYCWITALDSFSYIIMMIYLICWGMFSPLFISPWSWPQKPSILTQCGIRLILNRQAFSNCLNSSSSHTDIEIKIQMILILYMWLGKFVDQIRI